MLRGPWLDPFYLFLMGLSLGLSLGAQAWMVAVIRAQSKVALRSGLRGADVAGLVLKGLSGVRLVESEEWLGDHYDPATRTLHLSCETYQGQSVAAAGVAAHEAGHALQHAEGSQPMILRQKLISIAYDGIQFGVLLVFVGLAMGTLGLAKVGALLFTGFTLLTLVELPVEIDASRRARAALARSALLSDDELEGVARVLRASAATYLAATLVAILQLFYFIVQSQSDRSGTGYDP